MEYQADREQLEVKAITLSRDEDIYVVREGSLIRCTGDMPDMPNADGITMAWNTAHIFSKRPAIAVQRCCKCVTQGLA